MANQADLPTHTMCRVLKVSPSGFYSWRDRAPSKRSIDDAVTTERIRHFHAAPDAAYGMPRIRADLIEAGCPISRKRVVRLMRRAGLRGVSRRLLGQVRAEPSGLLPTARLRSELP